MRKSITVDGQQVSYLSQGEGDALVLLHGFTESLNIWNEYVNILSKEFRVIAIDLPGHGETGIFGTSHSMEFMADMVMFVLDRLGITSCLVTGHSMGGYVSLALARKYPALLKGLCLFHSHAAADSEEARKNRVRTINIVYSNRTGFIQQFIPELFAPGNVELFPDEIEQLRQQAMRPPPQGITAALRGMMERDDSTGLLASMDIPVLFIAGRKDSKIPMDVILQQAALPNHSEVLILGDAGHMGFIEERSSTLQTLRCFAKKVFEQELAQ